MHVVACTTTAWRGRTPTSCCSSRLRWAATSWCSSEPSPRSCSENPCPSARGYSTAWLAWDYSQHAVRWQSTIKPSQRTTKPRRSSTPTSGWVTTTLSRTSPRRTASPRVLSPSPPLSPSSSTLFSPSAPNLRHNAATPRMFIFCMSKENRM
ncbi:hypothetical protein B566_EDAN012086 [Ephemera danica]|nr:hypothetical protein B566_EDAN012086 [Ephemera danica]